MLRTARGTVWLAATLAFLVVGCSQVPGAAAPPSAVNCGPFIPAVKCNPALYSQPPSMPPPASVPAAVAPEPARIPCGNGFFDPTTASALRGQFGFLECFRFDQATTWIVFGDGMDQTTGGPSIGGSMVATLPCVDASTTCTDGDMAHDFSQFRVFYTPSPGSGRADLQATYGLRLLWISVGDCGLFTFDIDTGAWYGHDEETLTDLLAGSPQPTVVSVPPSTSGSAALTATAPPPAGGCQQ
jgi:hypothetical protein